MMDTFNAFRSVLLVLYPQLVQTHRIRANCAHPRRWKNTEPKHRRVFTPDYRESLGTTMNRNITTRKDSRAHRRVYLSEQNRRTPLEQLVEVRQLVDNGFHNCERVSLVFSDRRCVTFPADTKAESNRFTQCIRLISLLIENLTLKNTVTRRDLYYQDVQLFKSQSVVDSLIELFTQCMNITGEELGAIAAQKGLMVGDVTLHCPNGVLTDYRCFGNAMLIPRFGNGTVITLISEVDYILIVEKEAVLSQLIKSKEKRLLICGKGYADVLTKTFVNLLSRCLPDVPILGIADFDPYGFLILENYRSGKGHLDQSCPHLQYTKASILHFIKGSSILNLTLRDFKKCVRLLHTLDLSNLRARQEVQRLMVLGKKAELDVIKDPDGELVHYIDRMCRLSLK